MMNWKSITALGGIAMSVLTAFFYAPIPLTTGNVTGARYLYNIPQDIRAEIAVVNKASIERDVAARIAGIKMDYSALLESRRGLMLQDYKMQLMLLEDKADRIKDSGHYTDKEKSREMLKLEKRLDRLYDKVDEGGFRQEELRSANDKMMFAMSKG